MFHKNGKRTSVDSDRESTGETGSPNNSGARTVLGRPVQLKIDAPLLLIVVVLTVFGTVMLYSASYFPSIKFYGGNPFRIVERQIVILLLSVIGATIITFFNYHYWQRLAVPMMAVTVLVLLAVLFTGRDGGDYRRQLLGDSVQPSELAKLVIVIYLAVWLFAKREQIHKVSFGLIPLAIMLGVLGGLIYVQPDLSAVITVIFLGGLMFFLAGGDLKQIAILGIVALVVGWLVFQVSSTAGARVGGFIAGMENPLRAPDQVQRSIESFINGGLFGVGIGKGQAKLTALQVPHTDSIFAVIGEETGMLGAGFLLLLFGLLLWRGFHIARRAPDELGALLAAGLTCWIAFEAFINMASVVNLIPYAGNALPFVSKGGSNLMVTMVAIGILLNISRLSVKTQEENGRFFSAVVDLRGRNRRRGVSRSDRSRGVEA